MSAVNMTKEFMDEKRQQKKNNFQRLAKILE